MTTLPLPGMFDADASTRPRDGLIGLHRSGRYGEGNEFAGIRPFHAGDRMRRINWTRSTRSNELQVNSTWSDLDTHIALVIDATDDYGVSEGIDGLASTLDGAVRAAGAIAEHYALRGERVSLRVFGTTLPHTVSPGTGRAQLRRILDTLARVTPSTLSRTGYRTPASRQRGVVGGQITVLLSPLIVPEALDLAVALGRQGMSVIVVDTLRRPRHPGRRSVHRARRGASGSSNGAAKFEWSWQPEFPSSSGTGPEASTRSSATSPTDQPAPGCCNDDGRSTAAVDRPTVAGLGSTMVVRRVVTRLRRRRIDDHRARRRIAVRCRHRADGRDWPSWP